MRIRIFSVYDEKAQAFLTPFFFPHTAQALRAFVDCLRDPKHMFAAHPSDYTLYEHGALDNTDGSFEIYESRRLLANGTELARLEGELSDSQPTLFEQKEAV